MVAMPTAEALSLAEAVIGRLTGLAFPESRRDVLLRGLTDGMRRTRSCDLPTYLRRLETDRGALDGLVADLTVNETYFFRDVDQLRMIRDDILAPRLASSPDGQPVRIWSAGCASGEEPYSLAMLLDGAGLSASAHIVGTDIARAALARGGEGRYGKWSLRATPPEATGRYFTRHGDAFVLAPEIHGAVEFRYLNLATDAYPSLAAGIWGMDVVLCRNVLIYFDRRTVARVARRLIAALAPGGWLVTGASDPLIGDVVRCEVVSTRAGLAYRRVEPAARRAVRERAVASPGSVDVLPAVTAESAASPGAATPAPPGGGLAGTEAERPDTGRVEAPAAPPAEPTLDDATRAYEAHDYPTAAAVARRLTHAHPADPQGWVVLVRSLANGGGLEAAGRACAAALDRHRTSAELTYLHGLLLAEARRFPQAAGALRAALYLDRRLVVAHLALAATLARAGEPAGARRALRNAGRLLADMPEEAVVPASDGARAGRLAEAAQAHLGLLEESG
jgi:chemotaxis protein methyltransferase CheR